MENLQPAALIREQILNRRSEVEKLPGVYRWWFPKSEAKKLLANFKNRTLIDDRKLQERSIQGAPYLALYFGISNDMSRRIRWHIRGPFKSSTLRRTLWAIIAPDADDNTAETIVNKLIDSCFWEWEYTETVEQAECRETEELAQSKFAYPLNISKNNTVPPQWIAELKNLRKNLEQCRKFIRE